KKSKTPTLFIHGSEDTLVPPSMMEKLYSSCNSPKTKLVVKGAGHGDAMKDAGNDYWKAVFSFLENTSS
ncbi:MAG: alpha/beta hydrolase, partial [Succinivibrio sp.]|nr:alpha/beta hydrolase [Succinivibrio sp.]